MEFKEFKEKLVEFMSERYEGITFSAKDIVKNNGLHLTGITGFAPDSNISPSVYINELYDDYVRGDITFGAAATILEQRYNMARQSQSFDKVTDFTSYEKIKDKLVCRIVNRKMNMEILENIPHKPLANDLVITYRFLQAKDSDGVATGLIHNREFEKWNISLDELHKVALANTERLFPARMNSLVDTVVNMYLENLPSELKDAAYEKQLQQLVEEIGEMSNGPQMYVLSNDIGINGATTILYPSVQKQITEQFGEDVYILPSSIHEVMVVYNSDDENFLLGMVKEANVTAVGMQDYLADSIYKVQDGDLVNVNQYDMEIDQAIEELLDEPPENDFGAEM